LDLVTDILNKQGFSGFSLSQDFVKEWGLTNFLTELEKLNKINLQSGTFMFARKELFNSLCWILIDENEYIDKFSFKDYRELYDRGENLIKTAGELIYKNHGEAGMRDPMIWQFIPKSCSRFVDNAFNGIGGWLS
jgi:phage pi2 protein 07